jgi:hypothetical protein
MEPTPASAAPHLGSKRWEWKSGGRHTPRQCLAPLMREALGCAEDVWPTGLVRVVGGTMAIHMSIEPRDAYVFVHLAGTPELGALTKYADQLLAACRRRRCRNILVDARQLTGLMAVFDRVELGLHFQKHWDQVIRIAAVVREEDLPEHRVFENVAANRGLRVRMFSSEGDAVSWLATEPAGAA